MATTIQVLLDRLGALIKTEGISQAELARRVGIQPSHLNRFLKGHGDIRSFLFVSILEEMGIDLTEIVESELARRDKGKSVTIKDADHVADLLKGMPSAERRAASRLIEAIARSSRTSLRGG